MKIRAASAALIALVGTLSMAGSALGFSGISNGGFESGDVSGAPWATLGTGSTAQTGTTNESVSDDWIYTYWSASEGARSIDLSGDGPGVLSQVLATTAGNTYTVTFDLSGNPACGPAVKTLTVGASGAQSTAFSFDFVAAGATLGDMKWAKQTYAFVATGSTATLTFTSTTGGICGPALDNVVATETVPEPDPEPTPDPTPGTMADCKDGGWQDLVDDADDSFKNQGDCVSYVATDGRNTASPPTSVGAAKHGVHGVHADATVGTETSAPEHGATKPSHHPANRLDGQAKK
jgi:choice-of-anchor C domain-containing protein